MDTRDQLTHWEGEGGDGCWKVHHQCAILEIGILRDKIEELSKELDVLKGAILIPSRPGLAIHHIDGDPRNNAMENLRLVPLK